MDFSKRGTQKKQKKLRSVSTKMNYKVKIWGIRIGIVAVIGSIFVCSYAGIGVFRSILDNSPTIDPNNIEPEHFASTVYDNKKREICKLVGSDANRISVSLEEIPLQLQQAFIAIEDERFYSHKGIDIKGIIRVSLLGLSSGSFDQGASTITQQLLKNIVFSGGNETTDADKIQRKLQEQYLALELEKKVSKEEILENYLNTINLGQNTLGVQAASLRYFDKNVSELTLSECAVIAGITKNPSALNPISFPEDNYWRRNDVLDKMLELNMITKEEYDEALADDVYKRIQKVNKKKTNVTHTANSYFTDALIDAVLSDLQEKLGYTEAQATNLLYRGGLSIYTTQDKKLQKICDNVLSDSSYYPAGTQYQLTYRLSVKNKKGKLTHYNELLMEQYFRKSNPGFDLLFSSEKEALSYAEKYKKYVMKKGDTVEAEYSSTTIQPQISFVLMDQKTGKVKALVGGRGAKTASRTLNRATNSTRQPGSTFKVLSAYLPALDAGGMTLATPLDDALYSYPGTDRNVKNWYGSKYRGLTPLRIGIRDSMNVITVKAMEKVTADVSFDYLEKLGFTTLVGDTSLPANDVNLSTALGGLTRGVTNLEATAAYASIANNGAYREPILYTKILDHEGNVLLDNRSKSKQIMKESTSFLLTDAMKDVVTSGTGTLARIRNTGIPTAGKTGTTTKNVDAWFIGYTPYFTAGIWTGYDNNNPLPNTSYHKVIWRTIMEKVHEGKPAKEFSRPSSIVSASICTKSGKLAKRGLCDKAQGGSTIKTEYFAGSAPSEYCDCHISVTLCKDSDKIASPNCTKTNTKILLLKEEKTPTNDTPNVISENELGDVCDGKHKSSSSVIDSDFNPNFDPTVTPTWDPSTITDTVTPSPVPVLPETTPVAVPETYAKPNRKSSKDK